MLSWALTFFVIALIAAVGAVGIVGQRCAALWVAPGADPTRTA